MPVRIVLSQGQSSDKTVAPPLIEALEPGRDLIADRGYDARASSIWSKAVADGLISRPAATARSSARSIPPSIANAI
ncbi:transposase [Bradyrhizobium guangdongense]